MFSCTKCAGLARVRREKQHSDEPQLPAKGLWSGLEWLDHTVFFHCPLRHLGSGASLVSLLCADNQKNEGEIFSYREVTCREMLSWKCWVQTDWCKGQGRSSERGQYCNYSVVSSSLELIPVKWVSGTPLPDQCSLKACMSSEFLAHK